MWILNETNYNSPKLIICIYTHRYLEWKKKINDNENTEILKGCWASTPAQTHCRSPMYVSTAWNRLPMEQLTTRTERKRERAVFLFLAEVSQWWPFCSLHGHAHNWILWAWLNSSCGRSINLYQRLPSKTVAYASSFWWQLLEPSQRWVVCSGWGAQVPYSASPAHMQTSNSEEYWIKTGSQYSAHDALQPEVITFSMGFDASWRRNRIKAGIESNSIPVSRCVKAIEKMTSGRHHVQYTVNQA